MATRAKPLSIRLFQVLFRAGTCRSERAAALWTNEQKNMCKLLGDRHLVSPIVEEPNEVTFFYSSSPTTAWFPVVPLDGH
jgi:hypothetical protein